MNTVISLYYAEICNDLKKYLHIYTKGIQDIIPNEYKGTIQHIYDDKCLLLESLYKEPTEIVKDIKNENQDKKKIKHDKILTDITNISNNKAQNQSNSLFNSNNVFIDKTNIIEEYPKVKKSRKFEFEYTKEVLKNSQYHYRNWYRYRKQQKENGADIRLPIMPEDISETKIQYILQDNGDMTITRNCTGDLFSEKDGRIECKCITSDGAISFSPSSAFDKLYIMDARKFEITNKITLYKINYKRSSKIWDDIIVNKKKNQSFNYQASQGRRPRITFKTLFPYIINETEIVFEGNFIDD